MASAVLASQDEGYWDERKVYMRKYSTAPSPLYTHLKPDNNFNRIPNTFTNPKPHPSFRQIHEPSPRPHFRHANEPSPRPVPPPVFFENLPVYFHKPVASYGDYVTYNLAECSRREKKGLRRCLISELDRVKRLLTRIESRELEVLPSIPSIASRPLPVQPNSHIVEAPTEKQNAKAVRKNKLLGKKRGAVGSASLPYNRNLKRPALVSDLSINKVFRSMMKRCGQILTKLMKHKHGWVFNQPVDVKALGLHDYYQIIKTPMDLGTVKLRLEKNAYDTPLDFAADVRQTFNNAMKYNPKGQDVHYMAVMLRSLFEEMFNHEYNKCEAEQRKISVATAAAAAPAAEQLKHPTNFSKLETVSMPRNLPEPIAIAKNSDIMWPQLNLQVSGDLQDAKSPVFVPLAVQVQPIPSSGKLPKPKAKDPNKRGMTAAEKQKLGDVLQELPAEKLGNVMPIVRKRNPTLLQDGDEIELDIETLDNETLWELDRFAGYHKKAVSKLQRERLFQVTPAEQIACRTPESEHVELEGQQIKKVEMSVEEDVDIGEEILLDNFPPVKIERDAAGASNESSSSSSSRSGSDSSSSSDSDSESSSGSDSDEDSVQSPFVVSKEMPC